MTKTLVKSSNLYLLQDMLWTFLLELLYGSMALIIDMGLDMELDLTLMFMKVSI